jgi:predicted HicB family RNase H-like nuclease
MTENELLKKIAETPEVEPDEMDLQLINKAKEQDEVEKSGRIVLRLPKSLHGELIDEAKREGISLNQYCLYRLSSGIRAGTIK